MLNLAGSQFDFGHVVYAVLQECEHRRRGLDPESFEAGVEACANEKLAEIKGAYDEMKGSKSYWETLQKEVLRTVVPQYTGPALEITNLERNAWNVFRGGDIAARLAFALIGLVIGSLIIAAPFIPIVEDMFAFATTGIGFFYPDIKRYFYEHRYMKLLNKLVSESERYQHDARLSYTTWKELEESFEPEEQDGVVRHAAAVDKSSHTV